MLLARDIGSGYEERELHAEWQGVKGWQTVNKPAITEHQTLTGPVLTGGVWVYTVVNKSIDDYKTAQHAIIKSAFLNEMRTGTTPTGLGWDIDARRSGTYDDLQNMKELYIHLSDELITETEVVGADDDPHDVTLSQVSDLIKLIRLAGLQRIQKKHALDKDIKLATTIEQVQAVVW